MQGSKHVAAFRERHAKPTEQVLAWGFGYIGRMMGKGKTVQHNGVLLVTGERIVFYRKGFFGEIIQTIPLKNITSIERQSLLGHRTICIHTSHDELEFKTFEKVAEKEIIDAIEAGRGPSPV